MGYGFRNIVVAIAIMVVAASCIPDPLELDNVPKLQQKIVVSSQLVPGQVVAVRLTRSLGALEANDSSDPEQLLDEIVIQDAFVEVRRNGEETAYPLEYLGNGLYGTSSIPLEEGMRYTLFVNSATAGSVTATATVKRSVKFARVDAVIAITGRDTLAQVTYDVVDQPGTNWYMITGQRITKSSLERGIINPRVTTKFLNEQDFTDGRKSDTFKVLFDEVQRGDTISVALANIDKDYYDFMKLREDTRFSLAAALGEPINYPTNVEGGLGFFNLFVPDVHMIILKKE